MTIEQALIAGLEHHKAGRLAEAEQHYRHALALQPNNGDALHLLGMVALSCGNPQAAVDLIRRAIAIHPNSGVFYTNLGLALGGAGRIDEAVRATKHALELGLPPESQLDARVNHAAALQSHGDFLESAKWFRAAIELDPNRASLWHDLGVALHKARRQHEAETAYERALQLDPTHQSAMNNLATVYRETGRPTEALEQYQKLLAINPDFIEGLSNLGSTLYDLHRPAEAIEVLDRVITKNPPFVADASLNRAMALLAMGNLRDGFAEYEKREQLLPTMEHETMAPRWDGSPLDGKPIMLWSEQGFGDTIQFVRYASLVRARGGEVLIACQSPLVPLIRSARDVADTMSVAHRPRLAAQCRLLSLPHLLGTNTIDDIPRDVPYLFADAERIEAWSRRLGPRDERLRVGLAWSADPNGRDAAKKSMALSTLSALLRSQGAAFYSLQKHNPTGERDDALIDHSAYFTDFAETAALIHHLDVVISIDTAVLHLAGAMGKPSLAMLAFSADWRWLLNRSNSPWYPTMTLYRQPTPGDWASVIGEIQTALERIVRDRGAAS